MDLRLFVALDPPGPVRRELAARQARLRRDAGRAADRLRLASPEGMHLTLRFLGAVAEARLPAVREALAAAAAGSRPLRLLVTGAGGFPDARHARVAWIGVRDDAAGLAALEADLGRRLEAAGFPREARPLVPHFTLGRSRSGRGLAGLEPALAAVAAAPPLPWEVSEVALFRSHLSGAGARYEALARFPLGPGRDEGVRK